jgi:hypothetical protein
MPYDTPYNRMIARETNYLNQKYVTHSDMTGQGTVDYRMSGSGMSGGFLGALAGPLLGAVAGPLINKIFGGGPGVAEFKSANASKKNDDYEEESENETSECEECEGGANPRAVGGAILGFQEGTVLGRPKRKAKAPVRPSSSFSSLGVPARPVAEVVVGNANKVLSSAQAMEMLGRDRPMRGMGKRGRPKKSGAGILDKFVGNVKPAQLSKMDPENPPEYLINKYMPTVETKEYLPPAQREAKKARQRETAKKQASNAIRSAQAQETQVGSGPISNLGIPIISNIAGLFGLGKEKKRRGRPAKNVAMAVETVKATRGVPTKLVEKSQQVGSSMSGFGKSGGKKVNKRAEVVKKVMKERGVSMIEASKIVKSEGLY